MSATCNNTACNPVSDDLNFAFKIRGVALDQSAEAVALTRENAQRWGQGSI